MSSNIEVQKICQHCGLEFTARTTVTKYCGDKCAKRAYKARQRKQKIEQSKQETFWLKNKFQEELKAKEFLRVGEVAQLLGCSNRTIYRLIDNGKLHAVNLSERMTRIKRSELNKLWEEPKEIKLHQDPVSFKISECYTVNEIQEKYGVSDHALLAIIKRNNIPRRKQGKFVYVPKNMIDEIFG